MSQGELSELRGLVKNAIDYAANMNNPIEEIQLQYKFIEIPRMINSIQTNSEIVRPNLIIKFRGV